MTDQDPELLALPDLRALRASLQAEDDAISYVRRVVQARLDLVAAEVRRRGHDGIADITKELPAILGSHLTGGPARPPRPAEEASGHPLALELEAIGNRMGAADLRDLEDDQLEALTAELRTFEHLRSHERQELFVRIDALSAELVRRYRDGEADVDGLIAATDQAAGN